MSLPTRFSDDELTRIIDEATIYLCACPAQVAAELRRLRELHAYQRNCEVEPGGVPEVHQIIAEAAMTAHAQLETCMDRILELEGWDRVTLQMPEGLRRRRDALLQDD